MSKEEIAEVNESKPLSFSEGLMNSLVEVKAGLPADFNLQRFVNNSVALLNENETLSNFAKNYGVGQIKAGLMRSAYLGLDALNSEVYLIPYKSKLDFRISFTGYIKLVKKYSIRPIEEVYAKVVRQGDEFTEWDENGEQKFIFKPLPFNAGSVIGAFAVIKFKDGGVKVESMNISELEMARSKSSARNSMAWADFSEEMYKKVVVRRACKTISIDLETPQMKQYFDEETSITNSEPVEVPDIAEEIYVESEVIENEVGED